MKRIRVTSAVSISLFLAATGSEAAEDQTLHFVESETTLELTVPAGGVWLVIPREGSTSK